jgi:hypothetical protein
VGEGRLLPPFLLREASRRSGIAAVLDMPSHDFPARPSFDFSKKTFQLSGLKGRSATE